MTDSFFPPSNRFWWVTLPKVSENHLFIYLLLIKRMPIDFWGKISLYKSVPSHYTVYNFYLILFSTVAFTKSPGFKIWFNSLWFLATSLESFCKKPSLALHSPAPTSCTAVIKGLIISYVTSFSGWVASGTGKCGAMAHYCCVWLWPQSALQNTVYMYSQYCWGKGGRVEISIHKVKDMSG